MKLSAYPNLKKAIVSLPDKEKDKLLLRLIAKDKVLTEHLHFKLLEDALDLETRKQAIKDQLERDFSLMEPMHAKEALAKLRKMIGGINHFYKVSKDLSGEIELRLFLFEHLPLNYKSKILNYRDYTVLLQVFVVKSILATLKKIDKLHEDLQFDFSAAVDQVLKRIHQSTLKNVAADLELPQEISL